MKVLNLIIQKQRPKKGKIPLNCNSNTDVKFYAFYNEPKMKSNY